MSNYTKATNFTAKDSLTSGDPAKRVKGTEIDVELSAISNAIASKADSNSPTFTGTPAAPTASSGTSTTQIATTAFVSNVINGLGTIIYQDADDVDITGTINSITVGSNASGTKTVSTLSPSGGSNGDVWYKVAS